AGKRLVGVGERQEVVEKGILVGRPGEMLGEEAGLVAFDEVLQPRQVIAVKRLLRADRQPDAVQRQRIAIADRSEIAVRRAAGAHVVLGMDLEEADIGGRLEYRPVVLWLEPDAGAPRDRTRPSDGSVSCQGQMALLSRAVPSVSLAQPTNGRLWL